MKWLAEWIRRQLAEKRARPVALPAIDEPAIALHASIGYDTALTIGGDVWVREYDAGRPAESPEQWRLAGTKERRGAAVNSEDRVEPGPIFGPRRLAYAEA